LNPETFDAMSTSAPDALIFEPKTGEHHPPRPRLFSENLPAPNDRPDTRKGVADPLGRTVVEFISLAP
jgi:hypothetical protein